ncbi:MAG: hypothetical protein ACRD36_14270, partial [Candidatus Acidiferrum sp.]
MNDGYNSRDAAMPAGTVFDLDRCLPMASLINRLARFRGAYRRSTRWVTRVVAPWFARLAVESWRVEPRIVLQPHRSFLLSVAQNELRDGLPILAAEWMEFRRRRSTCRWKLLLRARSPQSTGNLFDVV